MLELASTKKTGGKFYRNRDIAKAKTKLTEENPKKSGATEPKEKHTRDEHKKNVAMGHRKSPKASTRKWKSRDPRTVRMKKIKTFKCTGSRRRAKREDK